MNMINDRCEYLVNIFFGGFNFRYPRYSLMNMMYVQVVPTPSVHTQVLTAQTVHTEPYLVLAHPGPWEIQRLAHHYKLIQSPY